MKKILIPKGKPLSKNRKSVAVACRIPQELYEKYDEIFKSTFLTQSQVLATVLEKALEDVALVSAAEWFKEVCGE
mgnify:CR=1 FL=1